jgi:putative alpha-1,2-mannosidase
VWKKIRRKLSVIPSWVSNRDLFSWKPRWRTWTNLRKKATAGCYSVRLKNPDILVELTATPHAGIHRYTFPSGEAARLFLNEGNTGSSSAISFKQTDEYTIEGLMNIWAGVRFIIQFDQPVAAFQTWTGSALRDGLLPDAFPDGGVVCSFGDLEGKR